MEKDCSVELNVPNNTVRCTSKKRDENNSYYIICIYANVKNFAPSFGVALAASPSKPLGHMDPIPLLK